MDKFPITVSLNKSVCQQNEVIEILVSKEQLLSSVSKIACTKAGIEYNDKYELITFYKSPLSMLESIEQNKISMDSHLILINPEKENIAADELSPTIYQGLIWKPLAIAAFLISVFGLIVLITIYLISITSIYTYGVVIDAGSTSSKIYLYYWASNKFLYNADVSQIVMSKFAPGISSYEANPNQSFTGILNNLNVDILPRIPKHSRSKTFVYLGATAGMRMLSYSNPDAANQIMNYVRQSLAKSVLKVNDSNLDISIISGSKEGLYGWTTINYLSQTLPKQMTRTTNVIGALDMGGASAEITFVDDSKIKSNDTFNLRLYGNSYNIYSHSYLCYGKSQAEYRFLAIIIDNNNFNTTVVNPCFPKGEIVVISAVDIFSVPCVFGKFAIDNYGYEIVPPSDWLPNHQNITFLGQTNYAECQRYVNRLFNKTNKCESCTFNEVYQPSVSGKFKVVRSISTRPDKEKEFQKRPFLLHNKLKAFSAFNLIKSILNERNDDIGLQEYRTRMQFFCNSNYSQMHGFDTKEDIWTKWKCFDLVYMIQLLENLGFNESNWKNIEFIDKIGNSDVGWALGFMIDRTSIIPKEQHFLPIADYLFAILMVVLLVILLFAISFTYFYCKNKKGTVKCFDYHKKTEEENLLPITP